MPGFVDFRVFGVPFVQKQLQLIQGGLLLIGHKFRGVPDLVDGALLDLRLRAYSPYGLGREPESPSTQAIRMSSV